MTPPFMPLSARLLLGLVVCVVLLVGAGKAAHAGVIYRAVLDGPSESPPVASPGTGFARVELDVVTHILSIDTTFSGLIGTTTAAHIHAPTATPFTGLAGVATTVPTFPGFPIGVTSGSYSNSFDTTLLSTFNPAFVTANGGTAAGAEAALATALAAGTAYFNIHTTFAPGGEIRGFLAPVPVPEPNTLSLVVVGGLGLLWLWRRRLRR